MLLLNFGYEQQQLSITIGVVSTAESAVHVKIPANYKNFETPNNKPLKISI